MSPVEMMLHQNTLIMRARNSELVILDEHVSHLRKLSNPTEFSKYFVKTALVNRPARKLFEAWLRKDHELWNKIFKAIHENSNSNPDQSEAESSEKEDEMKDS